jgi:hypothetical protein
VLSALAHGIHPPESFGRIQHLPKERLGRHVEAEADEQPHRVDLVGVIVGRVVGMAHLGADLVAELVADFGWCCAAAMAVGVAATPGRVAAAF